MYSKINPLTFRFILNRTMKRRPFRMAVAAGIFCALALSFASASRDAYAAFSNQTVFSQASPVSYGINVPAVVTVTAPTSSQVVGSQFDVLISTSDVTGLQINSW